jgi:hypothetical protein
VERPIRCVRGSFVYARDIVSDDDLNAQATTWLTGTFQKPGPLTEVGPHRT